MSVHVATSNAKAASEGRFVSVNGVRKMLFANLYMQEEIDLVAHLCKLEGCAISDLMRRAIAGLCDEQGIERPAGVFDDRKRVKKVKAQSLRGPGRPRKQAASEGNV